MQLTSLTAFAMFCVPTDEAETILHELRCALHTPGFGMTYVGPFTVTKQPTMFTLSDGMTWLTVPLSAASDLLDQMEDMAHEVED